MPARKHLQSLWSTVCFFHHTSFCETHVLSSVFPQAAEEDVGTASSEDRAEFFSVTSQSDNTGCSKSPTILKLFLLETEIPLHKMLTIVGGLHADVGMNHIFEHDGTLCADQVVQSMRFIFSEQSRVWRRKGQACSCATAWRQSSSPTAA